MREIKFRCWDKIDKRWRIALRLDFRGKLWSVRGEWIHGNKQKRYVVQQYTGRKDKNGKEIYEGDIVKYTNEGLEFYMEIKWEEAFVCFDFPIGSVDTEIIGNINQNKELLI